MSPEVCLAIVLTSLLLILVCGGAANMQLPLHKPRPPWRIDTVRCLSCNRPVIPQVINPGNGLCVRCEAEIRALLFGAEQAEQNPTKSTEDSTL